jgi:hypothetical protein
MNEAFGYQAAAAKGRGLFVAALKERFPDLPFEDEECMQDAARRDAFIKKASLTIR